MKIIAALCCLVVAVFFGWCTFGMWAVYEIWNRPPTLVFVGLFGLCTFGLLVVAYQLITGDGGGGTP